MVIFRLPVYLLFRTRRMSKTTCESDLENAFDTYAKWLSCWSFSKPLQSSETFVFKLSETLWTFRVNLGASYSLLPSISWLAGGRCPRSVGRRKWMPFQYGGHRGFAARRAVEADLTHSRLALIAQYLERKRGFVRSLSLQDATGEVVH